MGIFMLSMHSTIEFGDQNSSGSSSSHSSSGTPAAQRRRPGQQGSEGRARTRGSTVNGRKGQRTDAKKVLKNRQNLRFKELFRKPIEWHVSSRREQSLYAYFSDSDYLLFLVN